MNMRNKISLSDHIYKSLINSGYGCKEMELKFESQIA